MAKSSTNFTDIQDQNTTLANNAKLILIGNTWKPLVGSVFEEKLSIAHSPYFITKAIIIYYENNRKNIIDQGIVLKFEKQLPKYLFTAYKEGNIKKLSCEEGQKLYLTQQNAKTE